MEALSSHLHPDRDLVVAFLDDHPRAIVLLLTAAKWAQSINGRWRVVYIETPRSGKKLTSGHEGRMLKLLTRAKQMGAEVEHFEAVSLYKGIQQFLQKDVSSQISGIVIGRSDQASWWQFLRYRQWLRYVQLVSRYARVEVVPLSGQFHQPLRIRLLRYFQEIEPLHLLYAVAALLVPFVIALLIKTYLPPAFFRINEQNIGILFIITCAFISGRYGLIPGLVTAISGFFVDNYFFTLPYNAVKLQSTTELFSMGLFLSAALLISLITSQMRGYMQKISKRELLTEMLFILYRLASESYSRQQAMETLQQNLERMLDADIAFFMPVVMNPKVIEPACPVSLELNDNDRSALNSCWAEMKSTGAASPFNPGTVWRFEPMIFSGEEVGVLGARPHQPYQLDAWFGGFLSAMAEQTAAILTHLELERSMEATRISEEREKLRSMLLSSVSHDFKTPLAGIIGSLSAFQTLGARLKEEKRQELIEGSLEEARRLDSFITNILDMTRLEAGNIRFKAEWYEIGQLMQNVTGALRNRLNKRKLSVHLSHPDAEVRMDIIMTEQVLQNLIDNACKYTPPGTPISVSWTMKENGGALCEVRDHGEGIPPEKLSSIFDKYARLEQKDSQVAGTGLGLAIAKAIIEAQGGWIKVSNHPEGGAMFSFHLPCWRPAARLLSEEASYAAGS